MTSEGLSAIYARRLTCQQVHWLGEEIVDLLVVATPDEPLRCIGRRSNLPAGTTRIDTLLLAVGVGAGEEIPLEGFPGLGDEA